MRVVTTSYDHNSVLRPLFELEKRGKIELMVVEPDENGFISAAHMDSAMQNADFCAVSAASNVTGARINTDALAASAAKHGVITLVDGAQAVPLVRIDMRKTPFDMLALPGHKGLHGPQGTGCLIFRNDLMLQPLVMGGTGTASDSTISRQSLRKRSKPARCSQEDSGSARRGEMEFRGAREKRGGRQAACGRAHRVSQRAERRSVHQRSRPRSGIVQPKDKDSSFVAIALAERDFAVRGGLHCAPLAHKALGTLSRGAVRASIGSDNTEKDIYLFVAALEKINIMKR